jgi:anti-anti-sigma factor
VNLVVTAPSQPSEPHVLAFSGDLDAVTVPEVLERVTGLVRGASGVVVDLREVSFLDSSGVRLLHRLAQACEQAGAGLRVVAPPASRSRRVLELVGMTLRVDDDLGTARAALRPGG